MRYLERVSRPSLKIEIARFLWDFSLMGERVFSQVPVEKAKVKAMDNIAVSVSILSRLVIWVFSKLKPLDLRQPKSDSISHLCLYIDNA